MNIKRLLTASSLSIALFSTSTFAYVVGGASSALTPGSGSWSWDGAYISDFRSALEDPVNFGPGGIVEEPISTVTMGAVNAASLSGIDMFIAPWVSDTDAPGFGAAVLDFFLAGGDLFILSDDSSHDWFSEMLGVPTSVSTGSVSNGGVPLFDGPFGTASDVTQHYAIGKLDEADILAKGGHVAGTNVEGEVTSAYWSAGEYAAGAGSLFIIADVDMIATTTACGDPICGADYTGMNDNAIYALNTFSFLKDHGGTSVPEPSSLFLMLIALVSLPMLRRRVR
ncbi:PEP-CTERM sorting domain-containing protein [Simiduia aestuariiviva]|uniref:PEP-CTERM sorting domain-containing protein n=1 Tax=Simiduia aestuariiviva TaxID=1510459 RepID=A0A839UPM3_9GAMM|nr:PEP-CTERM sorting domain-containing protein [Simiduia aestuariiviva]MBB3169723.1 hypothetical protein [Simiduia aestuariiviva]